MIDGIEVWWEPAGKRKYRLGLLEKKVSGTICAKHPKGRFPANGS